MSAVHFQESLNKATSEVTMHLRHVLGTVTRNDPDALFQEVQDLKAKIQNLEFMVNNKPKWLLQLHQAVSTYLGNRDPVQLNRSLAEIRVQEIIVSDLEAEDTDDFDFDIDGIFDRLRNDSKIPALLDKIIDNIGKMLENDEIENHYVVRTLERLKAILEANKNGSYATLRAVLSSRKFYKTAFWNLLKTNEYGKAVIDAFDKVHQEMQEIEGKLVSESTKLLVDPKIAKKFEGNENLALPGNAEVIEEEAIDAEYEIVEQEADVAALSEPENAPPES